MSLKRLARKIGGNSLMGPHRAFKILKKIVALELLDVENYGADDSKGPMRILTVEIERAQGIAPIKKPKPKTLEKRKK